MRIGVNAAGTDYTGKQQAFKRAGSRFTEKGYSEAAAAGNTTWGSSGRHLPLMEDQDDLGESTTVTAYRSEAEKIYQAAIAGKPNPWENTKEYPKVPYGRMAKDGVIEYNGVVFTCDERTNSICLGDMTDEKNVLNIPLSGGGHLKVNRNSIGLLSKAAGMFSPEDLNLIMRAITQDAKIESVKKEIEDEEASVGNQLQGENRGEDDETDNQ